MPVTCNGPAMPLASHPFLIPPYHGWTSIVSYFDHDSPNFVQDGLVILANGDEARPDSIHRAADFPAYWDGALRQYLYYDGHNGYDYNLWYQPVYAAAPGKVIYANWEYAGMPESGYGRMIMIEHKHGYVTLYGHFSRLLVKVGQKVRAGQKIGISGNSGHSSGPHLHFTVFHNCTPTDPYGWTGGGSDPLSTFQGETSEYLWLASPLVDNPTPNWPGSDSLPAPPGERIVLLRLPTTAKGTAQFLGVLHREAVRVQRSLRGPGVSAVIDPWRGAVLVTGDVSASRIYSLPEVASISSPGTVEGDRDDVLHALARAALVTRHRRLVIGASRQWTGYLLRWEGDTFLVGHGERGKRLQLRLSSGRGGSEVWSVRADPNTGAYAVDLGSLTGSQIFRIEQHLQAHAAPAKRTVTHRSNRALPRPAKRDPPAADGVGLSLWIIVASLGIAALVAAGFGWRRRGSSVSNR